MVEPVFDSDSVVQNDTNIESFVPPYPGWNYLRILNHPEDPSYHYIDRCGKWLLFVPNKDFINIFRQMAKLAKEMKLTNSFKASGTPNEKNEHVFCIYCSDYSNISFVRKIANVLLSEGLLEKYGYQYPNGTKALFFKSDNATHYKSQSRGLSLTLFKFTDIKELSVKEFHNGKPSWKLITNDQNPEITDNFESHLINLEIERGDIDIEF